MSLGSLYIEICSFEDRMGEQENPSSKHGSRMGPACVPQGFGKIMDNWERCNLPCGITEFLHIL